MASGSKRTGTREAATHIITARGVGEFLFLAATVAVVASLWAGWHDEHLKLLELHQKGVPPEPPTPTPPATPTPVEAPVPDQAAVEDPKPTEAKPEVKSNGEPVTPAPPAPVDTHPVDPKAHESKPTSDDVKKDSPPAPKAAAAESPATVARPEPTNKAPAEAADKTVTEPALKHASAGTHDLAARNLRGIAHLTGGHEPTPQEVGSFQKFLADTYKLETSDEQAAEYLREGRFSANNTEYEIWNSDFRDVDGVLDTPKGRVTLAAFFATEAGPSAHSDGVIAAHEAAHASHETPAVPSKVEFSDMNSADLRHDADVLGNPPVSQILDGTLANKYPMGTVEHSAADDAMIILTQHRDALGDQSKNSEGLRNFLARIGVSL